MGRLQLIGGGIRALALANRWTDAAQHAPTTASAHLMEGRQAAIIAACIQGKPLQGHKILTDSVLTQPWERQVAARLHLMTTTEPAGSDLGH